MKLACQEQLLPAAGIAEKWSLARTLRFDAIELRGTGELGLEKRLGELKVARRNGAVFSSVCIAMSNFVGDSDAAARLDAIRNIKSQLSVIAELGGLGVITPASYGKYSSTLPRLNSPLSEEEQRQVLVEGLLEIGEHAAREGVLVLLEPLNRYETNTVQTLAAAASLCAEVGLPSVRIMADLYHMNIEEDDLPARLRQSANVLSHIHVCDSNRHEPGAGHIDFEIICKTLLEIGYEGYLALECRLSASPKISLARAVDTVRRALQSRS